MRLPSFSRSSPVARSAPAIAMALLLAACGSSSDDIATSSADTPAAEVTTTAAEVAPAVGDDESPDAASNGGDSAEPTSSGSAASGSTTPVDIGLFFDGALAEEVTTEACTLSGGAESTCYRITAAGDPVTYETGPFCPTTITDTAEAGGLWFDGNGVYDVDGTFITGLAELYNDDNWKMYDDEGNVLVVESAEEFDLAARPNVDPSLQNHCVEGRLEWLPNGEPISSTVVIPVEPVMADAPATSRGNLGVTLDGVVIAAAAPVDAILGAYTIAAFDDCGGHYNPNDGYHLHGAVGCSEVGDVPEGETPMFAYAMDGFPVHSALDDPAAAGLDACNGHETAELGYHYHANNAAENQVLECMVGQIVATADAGAGGRGGERPDGPPPGAERDG